MTETKQTRTPQPGDLVEITGHRVGDGPRWGEIVAVLGESAKPHFRVRWEDGHESIFFPSTDAVVHPGRRAAAKAAAKKKS